MSQFYNIQQNTMLAMLSVDEITAILVSGLYVFLPDHIYIRDIPSGAILDQTIMTNTQIIDGGFHADDLVFPNTIEADPEATGIVFAFSESGVLITHIDDALPVTPNGENIHILWNGPVFTF